MSREKIDRTIAVPTRKAEEHPHEKLHAWKESIALVKECYRVTATFPPDQRYGLASQIQRASISVPANLAEGSARATSPEKRHLYTVARASLSELDTLLTIASELGFVDDEGRASLREKTNRIAKLINGLIRYQASRQSSKAAR